MNKDSSKGSNNDSSDLIQRMLTGVRWATVIRLFGQMISWLSTFFVVRLISPEDYGLNAMLESPLLIFSFFCTLGLEVALVQRKVLTDEELSSVFGFLLILNSAIFAAFFLASPFIAAYFSEPRLEPIARAMAFVFLLVPFRAVPNALLARNLDFKLYAQVQFFCTVATAITTISLAYLGYGVWALVIGVLVNRISVAVLLMIMRPWFVWPTLSISAIKHLLSFGGLVALASIFLLLSDMLITLVAGPVIGAEQMGIYAVAAQFALMPLSKGMPIINQTMLPAFSKFQDDRYKATYYLTRLVGASSLVFIPMMVGFACVADLFVYGVIGEQWKDGIVPLMILSLGMIFRLVNLLYKTVITSMGRAEMAVKMSFFQFAILLVLTVFLTPHGIIALALAWVLTEVGTFIFVIVTSRHVLDTGFIRLYKAIQPAVIASAVMAAAVVGIGRLPLENLQLRLALQVLAGAAIYFMIVRYKFTESYRVAERALTGKNF